MKLISKTLLISAATGICVFTSTASYAQNSAAVDEQIDHYLTDKRLKKARKAFDKEKYEKAYKYALPAANEGNAIAFLYLGAIAEHSNITGHDVVYWYQKSADLGYAPGESSLSDYYYYTVRDRTKGLYWLRKSAEHGYGSSEYNLGVKYRNGEDVEQSYPKAVEWLTLAVDHGHKNAKVYRDSLYRDHLVIPHNAKPKAYWASAKAVEKYKTVTSESMTQDGINAYTAKNYPKAIFLLRTAANKGNANAQNYYGWMLHKGLGILKSDSEAVSWFRKSADQGNANGQSNLGYMYFGGRGIAKSYTQSRYWAEKSSAQNYSQGTANLAEFYEKGLGGLSKDMDKALSLLDIAAAQGLQYARDELKRLGHPYLNPKEKLQLAQKEKYAGNFKVAASLYAPLAKAGNNVAQYELGTMYINGMGVVKSVGAGIMWLRRSGEQGNTDAQFLMGSSYSQGLGALPESEDLAMSWYRKAAARGHERAQGIVARYDRVNSTQTTSTASPKQTYSWKDQQRNLTRRTNHANKCKNASAYEGGRIGYYVGRGKNSRFVSCS